MIYFPAGPTMFATKKSRQKANSKLNSQIVINDKIVNKKTEPTLFNVESARSSILRSNSVSDRQSLRKSRTENNQSKMAMEVLFGMNVQVVDLPVDYSLLESNSEDVNITYPNIIDMNQYNMTLNKDVLVTDKFPNSNNPIFQLDLKDLSRVKYTDYKIGKVNVSNLDLSKVVSDLCIVNKMPNGNGKNKYLKL